MSQNLYCCLPIPSPLAKWLYRHCKCCRDCRSCPTQLANYRNRIWSSCCICPFARPRIHPGGPENNKVVVRRLNSSGSGGGVNNLSFQADTEDLQDHDQVAFNNSSNVFEDGGSDQASTRGGGAESIVQEPSPQKEWAYKRHASSLYLKTGPAKCIHVIHIKVKNQDRSSALNSIFESTPDVNGHRVPAEQDNEVDEQNGEERNENDEDDDEEYWFSKWSNRPKLRCSMSPNQIQPSPDSPKREPHRLATAPVTPVPNRCEFDIVAPEEVSIELHVSTDETDGVTNLGFLKESGDGFAEGHADGASQCSMTLSIETNASGELSDSGRQPHFPVPDEIINLHVTSQAQTPPTKPYNMYKRKPTPPQSTDQNGATVGAGATEEMFKQSNEAAGTVATKHIPPLLLFVHGISASHDVWAAQLDYFHKRGYELVAFDLLGHGLSSAPPKAKFYTFESLLQDLVYVYDYFVPPNSGSTTEDQGQGRVTVLVGHGYGCCLTRVLSRVRPNHISALVSISGGGPTPLAPPGTLRPPTLLPFQIPNIFAKKRSAARFDPQDLRHVLPPNIRQYIIDGQIWLECDSAFHHRIQVPTLLVHGLRDTTVALVEECEMEKAMPKAFLELLPTAGHFPMLDEPRKLNRMLEKFLQAWLPSAASA